MQIHNISNSNKNNKKQYDYSGISRDAGQLLFVHFYLNCSYVTIKYCNQIKTKVENEPF